MKAENGTFDQWREDVRFLCDQYSHTLNRVDFYNSITNKPQLERWLGFSHTCLLALVAQYKRGLRWQIGETDTIDIIAGYLPAPAYYIFVSSRSFRESTESPGV